MVLRVGIPPCRESCRVRDDFGCVWVTRRPWGGGTSLALHWRRLHFPTRLRCLLVREEELGRRKGWRVRETC